MAIKQLIIIALSMLSKKLRAVCGGYAVCDTESAIAKKSANIAGFKRIIGARVSIKFINKNTAAAPTLDISGTGAAAVFFQGVRITNTAPTFQANTIYDMIYTGEYYELVGSVSVGCGV